METTQSVFSRALAGAVARSTPVETSLPYRIRVEGLSAYYGRIRGVRDVSCAFSTNRITAIIGPSGCGKSTFLRCLNRMHELIPEAGSRGSVLLRRARHLPTGDRRGTVRRRVGMVFQRPNPFPTMSIYDNVVAGLRLTGVRDRRCLGEVVERSLRQAALWDEVKDIARPNPAHRLSGGQQQRLCIARALAVEPGGAADGRAGVGARSRARRLKIEELPESFGRPLHDRDRDAQHAAGGARLGPTVVHARRRARGVRLDERTVHPAAGQADGRLHYRPFWVNQAEGSLKDSVRAAPR